MTQLAIQLLTAVALFACSMLPMGAAAAGNASPDTLSIGLFPRRDPAITMRLFRPLGNVLEESLEMSVSLETSPDFETFERRLQERRYDLVHLNQYHYVKAHDKLRYDVLVQNEEFGEPRIRGAVYVRRDSGITDLRQLKGRTVLFGGGAQAMMSYIVPSYLLRRAGLRPGDYRERFASSPPNAVLATYLGQADAGGAGEVVIRLPLVTGKIDPAEMLILARSEDMAHLPWAVKREMPAPLRQRIRRVLLDLGQSPRGREVLSAARLTAFNAAKDADYDLHRSIIDQVEESAPGGE